MTTRYSSSFFDDTQGGAQRSARIVLPHVFKVLQPASVVDVGCGTGAWASAVRELGVVDVLGIDGDYVSPDQLLIPRDQFMAADLSQPLRLQRRFDLAISMEVAEHLDATAASSFIDSLVRLAPSILFSAAIPYQGGTHHVNEQWPNYWARLFATHDYITVDCLRPIIWGDDNVEWWYRQNALLFITPALLAQHPALGAFVKACDDPTLSFAHPACLEKIGRQAQAPLGLRRLASEAVRTLRR